MNQARHQNQERESFMESNRPPRGGNICMLEHRLTKDSCPAASSELQFLNRRTELTQHPPLIAKSGSFRTELCELGTTQTKN